MFGAQALIARKSILTANPAKIMKVNKLAKLEKLRTVLDYINANNDNIDNLYHNPKTYGDAISTDYIEVSITPIWGADLIKASTLRYLKRQGYRLEQIFTLRSEKVVLVFCANRPRTTFNHHPEW